MRTIGVSLVALSLFTAVAAAAPAPLPKRRAPVPPTLEHVVAELRQRGYDVYEIRPAAEGQWEVTVRLVRISEEGESVQLITHPVSADGCDPREALLAFQAMTLRPPRSSPYQYPRFHTFPRQQRGGLRR